MRLSLTTERIWSWLASICVILTLVLFSYTIYCVVDNVRLKNRQKGIVQSIQDDIKIDDNTKMATKCGAGALFFGLLSGFFYYETQRKKKERAGIKEELKRDSRVVLQSTEGSLVSEKTHEAQKEELSLSNETTVNQAVAIHIHTESTSQVAVANVAVEQSPEAETVKDQQSEGLKELGKASAETNDIGCPKEETAEPFEERTKASKSDDNKPVVKTEAQKIKENARYAIGSTMDKSFRGPEDCIYNRFWEDVDTIVKNYQKPSGLRALIGKIATFVYRQVNESGQVITFASVPSKKQYMTYAKWVETFFVASGVELKGEVREKDFSSFKLETDAPEMKYLKAGSWEYFEDPEMRKRYLE